MSSSQPQQEPQEQPPSPSPSPSDPFDTLLSLESQYHAEGRSLGLSDGATSGRIEGRVFGLEKAYEKFLELGTLGGRAAVWDARLPGSSAGLEVGKEDAGLAPLTGASERLTKHVRRLVELTDMNDVSRENSEEGVQDFDDRLREAKGKAVLVEKLVGEGKEGSGSGAAGVKRAGVKPTQSKSGEMEDFGGLPRGLQK